MFRRNVLFLISCVAVVTAFECGQRVEPTRPKRIINGYAAGHWPWMVLIRYDIDSDGLLDKMCGGSVIGSRWVLTARHCVEGYDQNSIRMTIGETDVRDINNDTSMVHRNATSFILYEDVYGTVDNKEPWSAYHLHDIAVVELDQPLNFTEHIRPICLPSSIDPIYEKGAVLFTIGHGATVSDWSDVTNETLPVDDNLLQEMEFIADQPAQCKERLLNVLGHTVEQEAGHRPSIDEEIRLYICVKRNDDGVVICNGDSGSPVMLQTKDKRWFEFALSAHSSARKCGASDAVDFFANVAEHCEFIAKATKGEVTCIDV